MCRKPKIIRIMATSSKDIETLWNRYSSEVNKQGISVAQYFESNGIPYHVFEKWYKKRMQPSSVVDCVVSGTPDNIQSTAAVQTVTQEAKSSLTVSYINIGLSNGMKIEHHRISYDEMLIFVQKLQQLCLA